MLDVKKHKDERVVSAFTHKLADIPNGVTVASADFTQKILHSGTPIGKDENGLYHIIKTAKLTQQSTDTSIVVAKGHDFKIGDVVFAKVGGAAYAITNISYGKDEDTITVKTTLGTLEIGTIICLGKEAGASTGAFKYAPIALVGDNYDVEALSNKVVNAWTIGQVYEGSIAVPIPSIIKNELNGIRFI